MRIFLLIPLLALFSSCASESGKPDKKSASESGHQSLEQRLNQKNGYAQDANGNWVPQSDKRSPFESQGESPYFKGNVAKKEYQAGDYAKKAWLGNTRLDTKSYQGNTDGSRFNIANRNGRKAAYDANRQANVTQTYRTSDYKTTTATENTKRIEKTSDAETDERRKLYKTPSVVGWEEQREMSMEESKSLLGR